jgi:hypothetical protein
VNKYDVYFDYYRVFMAGVNLHSESLVADTILEDEADLATFATRCFIGGFIITIDDEVTWIPPHCIRKITRAAP